jgi:hypothetical protein
MRFRLRDKRQKSSNIIASRLGSAKGGVQVMSAEVPPFWEYLIINDDGIVSGISETAPEPERKEYEKWVEQQSKLTRSGVKV